MAALLLALAGAASAVGGELQVEEVRWGFDGSVVPQRFNLLTLRLHNPAPVPFEGRVSLRRGHGIGTVGAAMVQPVYLSPGASRYVQFHPYIDEPERRWWLLYGSDPGRRVTLKAPQAGPPAVVFLHDPDSLAATPRLPLFPAPAFPSSAAALDGLGGLVLDHIPDRWTGAQRTALLDWVHGGGILHLLHDAAGRRPVLPAELADLAPERRLRVVGAGLVFRHDIGRREVTLERLAAAVPPPELETSGEAPIQDLTPYFFDSLRALTDPEHLWWLFYILAVLYILLVGPINNYLGWRRLDYRKTYLFFFATVGVFSLAFYLFGSRGYDEEDAVYTLTYARPGAGRRYSVQEWTQTFVTAGVELTLTHRGHPGYYATALTEEAGGQATLLDGPRSALLARVPAFSQRLFQHRGVLPGPELRLTPRTWDTGPGRTPRLLFDLQAPETFPLHSAWAVGPERVYELERGPSGALRFAKRSHDRDSFLGTKSLPIDDYYAGAYHGAAEETDPEELFERLAPALSAWALRQTPSLRHRVRQPGLPAERLEVFLYADRPETFRLSTEGLGAPGGRVLYHFTLLRREGPDDDA